MWDWLLYQLELHKLRKECRRNLRDLDNNANRSTRQGQRLYDRLYDDVMGGYERKKEVLKKRYKFYKRREDASWIP